MPGWVKKLFKSLDSFLERLVFASERFMAQLCLFLVVPLALFANIAIIISGGSFTSPLKTGGLDWYLERYLLVIAIIAGLTALYSSYWDSRRANLLGDFLDFWTPYIAYTATALMIVFACLHWLL